MKQLKRKLRPSIMPERTLPADMHCIPYPINTKLRGCLRPFYRLQAPTA